MGKHEPVTIRGTTYATMSAAARDLGVSTQTVREARRRGTLDNVGLGIHATPEWSKRPLRVGDTLYETRGAFAEALGIARSEASAYATLRDRIEDPDKGHTSASGRTRRVVVDGTHYATLATASEATGIAAATLSAALRVMDRLRR